MYVMGKLDGEGLPRPLAAEELEIMLGNSQAKRFMGSLEFNSWRLNHRLAVFVFLPSDERNLEKPA